MTRCFLMRHGEAVLHAESDAQRRLSARGEKEVELMVATLLTDPPLRIWASPYSRAQQTAECVRAGLERHDPRGRVVETIQGATPNDTPATFMAANAEQWPSEAVLIVCHQPFVGALKNFLCDGLSNQGMPWATAGICCLALEQPGPGTATEQWYKSPA